MSIKKYAFLLLVFLFGFVLYGQPKIFLDENMTKIDSLKYSRKCSLSAFKCYEFKTDSLIINKVLNKFYFGKIKSSAFNQIRKTLELDTKSTINDNTTLFIKFIDTLVEKETTFKRCFSKFKFQDTIKNKITTINSNGYFYRISRDNDKFNRKSFTNYLKDIEKNTKKCIKKIERINNVKVQFIYNYKQDKANIPQNFSWVKDRGIFKNKFFKILGNYRILILKPNGEYFLKGWTLNDKTFFTLLKAKDWSKYKLELKKLESSTSFTNSIFFEEQYPFLNNPRCFE